MTYLHWQSLCHILSIYMKYISNLLTLQAYFADVIFFCYFRLSQSNTNPFIDNERPIISALTLAIFQPDLDETHEGTSSGQHNELMNGEEHTVMGEGKNM